MKKFLLIWMLVIFLFSSMPSKSSSEMSKKLLEKGIKWGSFLKGKSLSTLEMDALVKKYHTPFRKLGHMVVYFILFFLCFSCMKFISNQSIRFLLSFLFCFGYMCTDELHQLFVPGRSGCYKDLMIDSIGSMISMVVCFLKSSFDI